MRYFKNKPLGFDEKAVVTIPLPDNSQAPANALRARLDAIPGVVNVSYSIGAPISDNGMSTGYYLTERGLEETYGIAFKAIDRHYMETYDIKLAAGRWFNENDEKVAGRDLPEKERKI